MIRGIGVDIVECRRMEGREKRFYERFLSDDELMEIITPEYAASRFAAKEAFSKAIGTGIRGFSMRDITVRSDELGRPYFSLSPFIVIRNSSFDAVFSILSLRNSIASTDVMSAR